MEFTYEPEDFCFAVPVRARRASAREHLSSYRESSSRNPKTMQTEAFRNPYARAPFRRLPVRAPRQAVLRTSSWLAPSCHQQALRLGDEEDARCVQPTSATQSNCVHPHLACSRLALTTFAAGRPHRVLGSVQLVSGDWRFHDLQDRFGGPSCQRESSGSTASRPGVMSVGVFFPRRWMRSSL